MAKAQNNMLHKILNNFDTILLVVLALSLSQLHLVVGIMVLIPTGVYNTLKLIDYIKNKKQKREDEKTKNHFNDDSFI